MTIKSPRILFLVLVSFFALLIGAGCMASADDEVDTSSAITSSTEKAVQPAPLSASAVGALSQCTSACNEDYEACVAGAQSEFDFCMCGNSARSCVARCSGRRAPQQNCPAP